MARAMPGLLIHLRSDGTEERIQLRQDMTTLGRSASCTFSVSDPIVSRVHARIELQNDSYVLNDAGSANGTFVNGKRINQSHQLRTNDEIWLGSSNVKFNFSDPEERLAISLGEDAPTLDSATTQTDSAPNASDMVTPHVSKDLRETGVVNAMTSTSIHKHPDAFFNTRLPVLQTALNVEEMTRQFEPLLSPLALPGTTPTVSYAKLLAYKQGDRAMIQYKVKGIRHSENYVIFGKLYPEPSQATRMYKFMQLLWNDVFYGSEQVGVPQPLGYIPDLSMLVYIPAEGRFLSEVITKDQAHKYIGLAGTWLSTLHKHRLPLDKQFHLATALVSLQAWAALIAHKCPEGAKDAYRIAKALRDYATALRFETHIPIHSDFHYGHIVVNSGLKVFDLDELRFGDPNFDLAHFCASLCLLAHRQNLVPPVFAKFQNAFLDEYAHLTGWMPNKQFGYFYAYTCLKTVKQLCSVHDFSPENKEQYAQVQLMLEQGLAVLPGKVAKGPDTRFAIPAGVTFG